MGRRASGVGVLVLAATLGLAGCNDGGSASGEGGPESVTIRFGAVIGETHPTYVHGLKPFMEEVEEASGGSIKFEFFPDEQLAPGAAVLEAIDTGVLDMTTAYAAYLPEDLPLNQVWSLPLGMDAQTQANAIWRTMHEDNVLSAELGDAGVVPVMGFVSPVYEFATASKPLEGIDDLKGLRIRTPSSVYNKMMQSVGASPVDIKSTETYESLDRGTIDGTIYNFASWEGLSLSEVLHHATENVEVGTGGLSSVVVSQALWESLSDEQREIISEAGRKASLNLMTETLKLDDEARDKFVADGTLKLYSWPQKDVDELHEKFSRGVDQWVSDAEGSGLEAAAALEAARAAAEAATEDGAEEMPSYTAEGS